MKKLKFFLSITLLVLVTCLIQSCWQWALRVGEPYRGATVCYSDSTGWHGYVCAPNDFEATTWAEASRICSEYNLGGWDSGWELPSKFILNEMYLNKNKIGGFSDGCEKEGGDFHQCSYWTSESNKPENAWNLYFATGIFWDNYSKASVGRFRPVHRY